MTFSKDIYQDVDQKFDSSFLKNHKPGIPTGRNKKVIRMMKDEAGGKIIEFVGLRAKLYYYKMHDEKKTISLAVSVKELRKTW